MLLAVLPELISNSVSNPSLFKLADIVLQPGDLPFALVENTS
jgi:hypothetical protein